ncbi:MAG TPA: efflux RND transporter periplasmic adaptor subunit, partial [Rhodocyclaceae bacterium]
ALQQLRIERSAAPRKSRSWRGWAAIAAVAVAAFGTFLIKGSTVAVETASVTTAYPYLGVTLLNATGYVVAQRKAAVATKATGRLEWLGVQEGSVVKAGQVIARLEQLDVAASARQAAAGVQSAKAELQDAKVGLDRAKDLAQKKFIAVSALDAAQARFDKARAAVAVAEAARSGADVAVDQTQIRAPFDGVVLTKAANVGDIVTPFSSALESKGAVVTMADMDTLEVEADVAEANLSKIKVGQPCEIALDAFPELRLRGEVSRLVPTVDRAKASVMTKVRFVDRDPRVLPEMSAKVAFLSAAVPEAERQPLTVVHKDALAQRDGRSQVFIVHEGEAKAVTVSVGRAIGDLVAVSGLKPGDKVVLHPSEKLRDGSRVTAAQK